VSNGPVGGTLIAMRFMEQQVFPLDAFPKDSVLKPDFFMRLQNPPCIGFHDSVNPDIAITAMGIGRIMTAPKQSDQVITKLMSELHEDRWYLNLYQLRNDNVIEFVFI
jgi:hypothetical protein